MSDPAAVCSFGSTHEWYFQYIKRTDPVAMRNEHYHSFYEVYYMLSGSRLYFIRDRSYTVEQGDLVFIRKHELHKTMPNGQPEHERILLHFSDESLRQYAGELAELLLSPFHAPSHVFRLPTGLHLDADALLRRMHHEARTMEPGCELVIRQGIAELLLAVARYLRNHEPVPFRHASSIHAKISEVTGYINTHYREPLRLESVSKVHFISPHYLSRMFKRVTGFAFTDYIAITRMKEAERLLKESTDSISSIAGQVGYDNFSHFGKTFKRVTGMSPREYRRDMS
ncbi:helix-turn-helix domain-containing protein [Paenibacillus sp. J5C_2022]|uniref:helix-turn-helix transcriptional regulator n=1 Tax=Paenibacillus sp. J5C2022 TaxID=2977129 RepID=UPI0021CF95FD|nr:helix-turn-helix domain-containing protein [Paenibacillus sp. J5C2022]MCU6710365.1 helix-turn-helix domain-containing protein [Paenibacillus sp. J5C2022]